jgi:hypothetical protein
MSLRAGIDTLSATSETAGLEAVGDDPLTGCQISIYTAKKESAKELIDVPTSSEMSSPER